jgi:putative membrane protein
LLELLLILIGGFVNNYWSDWYSGWGWFLWIGVWFLLISSFGNWGYTYRAHRLYRDLGPQKRANDLLNERYAKGEINRNEYLQMKRDISEETSSDKKVDAQFSQHAPA